MWRIRFCSTRVSVQVSPIGVQPWETTPLSITSPPTAMAHAAVLIDIAVEINLRQRLGEIAAGQAAIHRQPG